MDRTGIGIGIVGAGKVAEMHELALRDVEGVELVALYDRDEELAAARSLDWGVPASASFAELIGRADVDAVYVLASGPAHEALTIAAMGAGKHVLVEKPVGPPAAIETMMARSDELGLVCAPAHNYAYDPQYRQMQRLVRRGELGEVRAVWITYAIAHPPDLAGRYGGVLSELMVHHSYLTLGLLGPPDRVHAGRLRPSWTGVATEDQAWMVWEYDRHASAHLFGSFAVDDDTADPWTFIVKILGSEGGATYSWRSARFNRQRGTHPFAMASYEDCYRYEAEAFRDAVRGDRSALNSTLEDALVVARLLERAQAGTSEGGYTSVAFDLEPGGGAPAAAGPPSVRPS
jgi:predicted dehydrogenase